MAGVALVASIAIVAIAAGTTSAIVAMTGQQVVGALFGPVLIGYGAFLLLCVIGLTVHALLRGRLNHDD